MNHITRNALLTELNTLLASNAFEDYCPNGMQVEGQEQISHVVTGVTASMALIEEAIKRGANAIIVHHGLFWKADPLPIIGFKKQRLAALLKHDISLFAWHLPLDAHPQLGNNAKWAQSMGWQPNKSYFGEQNLGWLGTVSTPQTLADITTSLERLLSRAPLVIGAPERIIKRVAWCSGGAQSYFSAAIDCGIDLFVTGEASEPVTHLAREANVAYIAAGHHATERFGVQALAHHIAAHYHIEAEFVDISNPV